MVNKTITFILICSKLNEILSFVTKAINKRWLIN